MDNRPAVIAPNLWIAALIVAAGVAGVLAAVSLDFSGQQGNQLNERFDYSLAEYQKIDPSLVHYRQTATVPVPLAEPTAIAVGPEDRVYVAGDHAVAVLDAEGKPVAQIALEGRPRCLAVAGLPPLVYLGMETHVEVYNLAGKRQAAWAAPGDKAYLTSIAAAENGVFVADAGQKIVHHYDLSGKLLGRIGERNPEKEIVGFAIPSPYFDLAITPDGLLRVVNPAYHRIEAYTFDGDYEQPLTWGKASLAVDGFCGCCNPSNIAILSDGSFVTAEKGILRVKVYSHEGRFMSVVAAPDLLAPNETAVEETRPDYKLHVVDVAADSRGRVLVLDPQFRLVRVFEHASAAPSGADAGEKR